MPPPGKRLAPDKLTPLRSKILDVQSGHQVASFQQLEPLRPPDEAAKASRVAALQQITIYRRYDNDLRFPLSADHLIHLVQLNVYRALLTNMLSLSMTRIFECSTSLDESDSRVISALPYPAVVPPQLEPTALQQCTAHSAWIDLFPLPAMRDILIRAEGTFDECDLYVDVLGSIGNKHFSHKSPSQVIRRVVDKSQERRGIVVWGDPWCVSSWEVEEGFARKWGWMIRNDCEELLQSTNRWRQSRGEKPVNWAQMGFKNGA